MSTGRSIWQNMRDLAGANIAVKPLWFLFLLLSTRLLGAAEFGRAMLALSFVTILAAIFEGGVDALVVRELAARPANYGLFVRHSLLFKCLSGLAVGALAWGLSLFPVLGPPARELLLPAVVYSFFNTILLHVRAIFRAFEVMHLEAVSMAWEKGLVIALCGISLSLSRNATGYLAAMAAAYMLATILAMLRLRRFRGWDAGPGNAQDLWHRVLRPSLPFALMNLFVIIYFRSGTLMLKSLTGSDELVGHYSAGYRLLESYMLFPTIITAPLYPVLARRLAAGDEVGRLISRAAWGVLGISLLITLPLFAARSFFTVLLFGADFAAAANAVGYVALAMIPVGLTFVFGTAVAAAGRQRRANVYIVGATILNLGLNAWSIPRWGAEGAASTTVLTELCICAGNFWVARDLFRTSPAVRVSE